MTQGAERLTVTFSDIAAMGGVFARHDGDALFADYGIPGEEAVVCVERGRRRHLVGRLEEVLTPSPHRTEPRCPHFGTCSGCQWQHIDYPFQLALKRRLVERQFQKRSMDAPVLATLPAAETWHYRNHARFSVDAEGRLGFINRESRAFVAVDHCYLMHPWINGTLARLQGRCPGAYQVAMRYGANTGSYLIQPRLDVTDIESGQRSYQEELLGQRFDISASSFFQVNTVQAERLVEVLRDRIDPQGSEVVVDVYAGVGTFALLLAPVVGRVIAVEEAASALKDAQANIARAGEVEFVHGKAENVLPQLSVAADVAILDPPRVGCHRSAIAALHRLAPRMVLYVSCDPAALARDVEALCQGGYRLAAVQPLDMFPQTYHVECVAHLVRGDISPPLVLASASPRRRELLSALGLAFDVVSPPDDEHAPSPDSPQPQALAEGRAQAKGEWASRSPGQAVVAADTVVVHRGDVLGKPRDREEASAMLERLKGERHTVITGVYVANPATGDTLVGHEETQVHMRRYSDEEVARYISSGDPDDKAGAYGIQDPSFRPASHWEGCYLNVVGLPLCRLRRMLEAVGVAVRARPLWALPAPCRECPHREELTGP